MSPSRYDRAEESMRHYLDHAATTPLRPESRDEWLRVATHVGNPSSIHESGQAARRELENARERLAAAIECDPIEVLFTSGGTEAVNLALKGLWWSKEDGQQAVVLPDGEHHATLDAAEWMRTREHAEIRPVALDEVGRIREAEFRDALESAALATALAANNEVGTVNDVVALAEHAARASVPLHIDAIAAFGHVPVSFRGWRGDARAHSGLVALSLSAHKIGGPAGTGALVVSRHARLTPLLHGGGQQRGLRAGTQDAAGAAAFAVAAELAVAEREAEAERLRRLRERMVAALRERVDGIEMLGDPHDRIPGNVHLLIPGALGETLLFLLDQAQVSVSTGSACQAGVPEPSHVVMALGRNDVQARQVLRVSLGHTSTDDDVDAFVAALPTAVERARAASGPRPGARS